MEEVYLTKEGYRKLLEEVEFLSTIRRRELAKAIGEARAHGDISENAEYDAAKDAQALNEERIAILSQKIAGAKIIDNAKMPKDQVLIGAKVELEDLDTGQMLEYILVSDVEADYSQNKISVSSPVGKGLLNHRVGDKFEINVPAGILRYKIVRISR